LKQPHKEIGLKFIADFHIHSHFSVATSSHLEPEHLEYWARLKGIDLIGTGDCIHPGWMSELREKLERADNGLYRLKSGFRLAESRRLSGKNMPAEVYFMPTGEISNIYKKNGGVRKVHNLCVFPDFEAAAKVQSRLDKMGNIRSDGRPILGLDSKILFEMVLESSDGSFLIPAHIWTPWFSVLGSKSGFDRIQDCFDDLTPHLFALETGLSSDPPMNRTCSFIDRFTLVSNSDAHSPEKLGREANLFDTELSHNGIYRGLKMNEGFSGTIEFFPQEGKYHYDGHRKCGVRWDPLETVMHDGKCTKCGKPVTKGVMYRVAELADRPAAGGPADKFVFHSITELPALLAEIFGQKSARSTRVMKEYHRLVNSLGSEFYILLDASLDEISEAGGEHLAEGIRRLRNAEVIIEEGYDGEFGRIRVFGRDESQSFSGAGLFAQKGGTSEKWPVGGTSLKFDIGEFRRLVGDAVTSSSRVMEPRARDAAGDATVLQQEGIEHGEGPCMVIAGPGTGKTRILTRRIVHLVRERGVDPRSILAVTFSNKAATEMRDRVRRIMPVDNMSICTFHAFGLSILKELHAAAGLGEGFYIIDDDDIREILSDMLGSDEKRIRAAVREVESAKQGIARAGSSDELLGRYREALREMNAVDINDLIHIPTEIFRREPEIRARFRERHQWLLVDEFQDINAGQYDLLKLLAGPSRPNLFVIGDPDQSIYGFRGSDPEFMKTIEADYPEIRILRLDRSFRCPDTVMQAAGQVLGRTSTLSGRVLDMKIRIQETESDRSEADWIAATIESSLGGVRSFSIDSGITDGDATEENVGFSDFAVLCRASFMFDELVQAFRNHAVPCQVVGSDPLFRQEPYRTALRLLKRAYYRMPDPTASPEVGADVREMIDKGDAVSDVVKFIMVVCGAGEEELARIVSFAERVGGGYQEFFGALSLRQGFDDWDDRAEAVSLMTLHASKGLEFNTVFIPGCEKGILPFELFGRKNDADPAEEERLFYVGVTRTVKNLYLTHAKKRTVRGRVLIQERSPFLDRLERTLLVQGKREGKKPKAHDPQLDLFK
jgi:DNA helicase-2/ATP-dependent DNA helicase PcrA